MPPAHPPILPAAEPLRRTFDPWSSSSTGHQRAENHLGGSTSWRQSRTAKLRNQFAGGPGGGKRMFDTVGAGSEAFGRDGRKENGNWEKGAPGLREAGCRDIGTMIARGYREGLQTNKHEGVKQDTESSETNSSLTQAKDEPSKESKEPRGVLQHLSFYINGSTAPMISDHKLKQLIAENGGKVSLGLARRSVTHVIVGRPNGLHGGAGGGLSSTKIEKEIQRVRGCGIKFVNVEWVIQSLKEGRRLPEHQFQGVDISPPGVKGIVSMFGAQEKKSGSTLALKKKINGSG